MLIELLLAIIIGILVGIFTGLTPGIGSAQASIIGSQIVGGQKSIGIEGFIILQAGINVANFIVSFATLYTLAKARNGVVVAVLKIVEKIGLNEMVIILAVSLLISGIASILSLIIARQFITVVSFINYRLLSIIIGIFILVLTFFLCGWIGLFVLFVASMIGLSSIYLGIEKNHAMGCILLPVILYFII